ncbi:IS5 family transposase [Comamonas kerstersii]|nr:IS5 family transposase [Comamonas kerstersii]OOH91515.1 IS5 family transposase [Comamonas kerstersii]
MTTKILALTDALGNLVRFVLMPGQRHDLQGVTYLLQDIDLQALLADKAFDANWLVEYLQGADCQVVIAQKANRTQPLTIDKEMYKWRHLIENYFCKLKEFKRIALRSDKTDSSFAAVITLVSAVINSR